MFFHADLIISWFIIDVSSLIKIKKIAVLLTLLSTAASNLEIGDWDSHICKKNTDPLISKDNGRLAEKKSGSFSELF